MGSGTNLQMEPGRSSREPPLDYQRWTKIGFIAKAPGARARVPRTLGDSVLREGFDVGFPSHSARVLLKFAILRLALPRHAGGSWEFFLRWFALS